MMAKYDIDYIIHPQHNKRVDSHRTNDPVEAEDFLTGFLHGGARILEVKREGIPLKTVQRDRMLRIAAERLTARLLSAALDADYAAVKRRFGFAV